ncbi:MAG: ABC transporter substrate-binding protein [Cetobacterium sp.]
MKIRLAIILLFIHAMCFSKVFIDGMGRSVEIPTKIERVISTVPSNTEMIIDMNLVSLLIGVDTYSEELHSELEGKGFFKTDSLNEERIIEMMPDLVIASHHNLTKNKANLKIFEEIGIPIYILKTPKTLEEISDSILEIGLILNRNEEAKELNRLYVQELNLLKIKNSAQKKRVYFEISSNPFYTTGSETFLNDVLESGGGKNIFSSSKGWISPSIEVILESNPEVIFVSEERKKTIDEILNRPEWKEISAVKNNRVYSIDESISRPSPRVLKSLEEIKNKLVDDKK